MSATAKWDAVVFTSPQRSVAQAHSYELKRRQQALQRDDESSVKESLVLIAEDPSARIGSGGATLNAILVVMEHFSSLAGFSVRDSSVLQNKRVLIVHVSGASSCEPCGKTLTSTGHPGTLDCGEDGPFGHDHSIVLPSMLDRLMVQMDLFLRDSPCGVFIVSTETNLQITNSSVPSNWSKTTRDGVLVFATSEAAGSVDQQQGLIKPSADPSKIERILFPATKDAIRKAAEANAKRVGTATEETVLCFSGVIFLSHPVTDHLMEMCIGHPLNACTYLGIDAGVPPLPISLCLDILPAMTATEESEYLVDTVPFAYSRKGKDLERINAIRKELYSKLQGTQLRFCALGQDAKCEFVPDTFGHHLRLSRSFLSQRAIEAGSTAEVAFGPSPGRVTHQVSHVGGYDSETSPASAVVQSVNSILHPQTEIGVGSLISNCVLGPNTVIGRNCVLKDINLGGYHSEYSDGNSKDSNGFQGLSATSCRDITVGDDVSLTQWQISLPHFEPSFRTHATSSFASASNLHVRQVYVLFGTNDYLGNDQIARRASSDTTAEGSLLGTYLNEPWDAFFERTGIRPSELWHEGEAQTPLNARLFPAVILPTAGHLRGSEATKMLKLVLWMQNKSTLPPRSSFVFSEDEAKLRDAWKASLRLSLRDIRRVVAAKTTICARVEQAFFLNCRALCDFLAQPNLHSTASRSRLASHDASSATPARLGMGQNQNAPQVQQGRLKAHRAILHQCAAQRRLSILQMFDDCAASSGGDLARGSRAFAWIANMLGKLAGAAGGLRSGPANNIRWRKALQLVAAHPTQLNRGVAELALCRREWLAGLDPLNLVRAARHYERASQILIREAVMSARQFIDVKPTSNPKDGASSEVDGGWTTVEASARIDLSGGWSDTPPIAYEHGGAVTNIAVLVDGKRPIGVKVRRTPIVGQRLLVFVVHGATKETVVIDSLHQLLTYHQPQSPAALLKAAVCCAGLVDEHSSVPLAEQLESRFHCGFEMHSWSDLPAGSGLGTSSILAGCAMAALWSAMGLSYDRSSVYHAVLHLEQMLTTGGGWQDQVGGIAPGVKLCTSSRGLPLQVHSSELSVPAGFIEKLSSHIVLIYTGRTRLARDLLQNVLRNWYSLDPTIVQNVHSLVTNAQKCAKAAEDGDVRLLGECVDTYWSQKKVMAPGCEPVIVTKIIEVLRPISYGLSMCGAGGGGFMYAVTKEPNMDEPTRSILHTFPELRSVRVHRCSIDTEGMLVSKDSD